YRSPRHVYAQIIDEGTAQVIVSASTTERELRDQIKYGGNVAAAQAVGKRLADRAIATGVSRVAFDRSGYKYHGRVKALADAAREGGLQF
ncbi:MAG TPA: 50S ribosomal protein L18, partial [Gammaproteobacteria bacterium]|nr:50S ribosomal protein L18 [Gammaproteobacteria bacterium]